tara:strand:+ start:220 stop:396 length:177 start_codon:yes stop_codon:yes gene_type:complete
MENKSPVDKSCEIADKLTKGFKQSLVRAIVLTAIANLDDHDHKRLYEQLFKKDINENN